MSSVKGWQGAIKYSDRQVLEAVGIGDDADTTWESVYEVDDELGIVTDDTGKIEVFLDGVLQATTLYTLDGDGGTAGVGLVTFTTAPGPGVVIEFSYYTYKTVGYVQTVGMTVGNNVDPIFQLGSRLPVELKEGNIDITLSLSRSFIDLSLISTVSHQIDAIRGWLASELFDIDVLPKGDTATYPLLTVRGKFNSYGFDMSQDGIANDSVDFTGKTITDTTI